MNNQNNNSIVEPHSSALGSFLAKTYAWTAATIAVAFITMYVAASHGIYLLGWSSLVPFIIGFIIMWAVAKSKNIASAYLGLLAFAVCIGLTCSYVFLFSAQAVSSAFVATAVDFSVMSLYGIESKRSFAKLSRQLFAAIIGLIVTELVMLLLSLLHVIMISPMMMLVISGISAVVFSLCVVCDSHRLVDYYDHLSGSALAKASVLGAMNLFLDFINIFLDLVYIFSGGRNN